MVIRGDKSKRLDIVLDFIYPFLNAALYDDATGRKKCQGMMNIRARRGKLGEILFARDDLV